MIPLRGYFEKQEKTKKTGKNKNNRKKQEKQEKTKITGKNKKTGKNKNNKKKCFSLFFLFFPVFQKNALAYIHLTL